MSDNFATIDPFSQTALDETTEFRALLQALRLAHGFKLILVRCNQTEQRQRLVAKIRAELESFNVEEVHFSQPVSHLLDELRHRISHSSPDLVLISGLEYSLPFASKAPETPLIANLNASRNSFPELITCPLVLFVPDYVLTAIMLGAPDFFSIRSGVYFFASDAVETAQLAQTLTIGSESTVYNLLKEEKEQRVTAIESLLADYQSLPSEKREPESEMRLRLRLANILYILGSIDLAKDHYRRLLEQAKSTGDRSYENWAIGSLGIIHLEEGSWPEAEAYFKQNLDFSREIKDRYSESSSLSNLGTVYRRQGKADEAFQFFQQYLELARELGDREDEANALLNLGIVSMDQQKASEAESYLQQSLALSRAEARRGTEARVLNSLGVFYSQQGRLSEAQGSYEQALEIAVQLGESAMQASGLHNLSILAERKGDLRAAIKLQKQAIAVLEKITATQPGIKARLHYLEEKLKFADEAENIPQ